MEKVKKKTAATLLHIMKNSAVLWIALAAAGITCIFVPIDRGYLDYFDLRTLSCLFCTLAVVGAFKNIKFFVWLADKIVRRFKSVRGVVLALVSVTYFGSMIMAFTIDVRSALIFVVTIPVLFAIVFAIMLSCIPL